MIIPNQFGTYRAKRKDNNKIIYGAFIQCSMDYGFIINFDGEQRFEQIMIENKYLSICTGLKDKNGAPIYGSFPIYGKMTRGGNTVCDKNEMNEKFIYKIIFDNELSVFYAECINEPANICYLNDLDNPEIIGSQWEGVKE